MVGNAVRLEGELVSDGLGLSASRSVSPRVLSPRTPCAPCPCCCCLTHEACTVAAPASGRAGLSPSASKGGRVSKPDRRCSSVSDRGRAVGESPVGKTVECEGGGGGRMMGEYETAPDDAALELDDGFAELGAPVLLCPGGASAISVRPAGQEAER